MCVCVVGVEGVCGVCVSVVCEYVRGEGGGRVS